MWSDSGKLTRKSRFLTGNLQRKSFLNLDRKFTIIQPYQTGLSLQDDIRSQKSKINVARARTQLTNTKQKSAPT